MSIKDGKGFDQVEARKLYRTIPCDYTIFKNGSIVYGMTTISEGTDYQSVTGVTDDSVVIQDVFDALAVNGGSVFIQKGAADYLINTRLDAVANVKVYSNGATLKKTSNIKLLSIKDVDGFEVNGPIFDGGNIDGNNVVYAENADRTKILNSQFINPPTNGFMLTFQTVASYYCEVAGNYFNGGGVTGMDAFAGLPFKSTVHHNRVYDSPYSGITSGVVEDCVISDNIIIDATGGGITIDSGTSPSYRNIIKNNVITGSGDTAIYLYNNKTNPLYNTVISGNHIDNSGGLGIKVGFGKNTVIAENIIDSCHDTGIGVRGQDYVVISGNVITNPNGGSHEDYRDADGIAFYSDPISGTTQYGFAITDNIIQDVNGVPKMKAGISCHVTSGSGLICYDGIIKNNVVNNNFVNFSCAIIDESFGTASHDWDAYNTIVQHNHHYGVGDYQTQTGDWADPSGDAYNGLNVIVYNSTQAGHRLYCYTNDGWHYVALT